MKLSLIITFFCAAVLPAAAQKNQPHVEISGIYPHLAMYNTDTENLYRLGETGVGAIVPWAGKLWVMTYPAHEAMGSQDKLYEIDSMFNMRVRAESVGGTHANRMIHRESNQLIIGPYFISDKGEVRVIPPAKMPGRLTATARHLTDPARKVYFYTMEEGLYEVDVYSLEVTPIHWDGNYPPPSGVAGRARNHGYHGKGAYTAQGRLIVSNNGVETWRTQRVSGTLAEWDGKGWNQLEMLQFTEITGPDGIYGQSSDKQPVWAVGWDEKSVILKLLENGKWSAFRLPKASYTYDGAHGWHTEWPRIREIGGDRMLMTMHGMFWDFPKTFSLANTGGIRPLSSYLKIVGDFALWQGKIVLGTDDATMFDNYLVGRPQSNLVFLDPEQLAEFGPRNGWGAVWMNEFARQGEPSASFLTGGFDNVMVHLAHKSPDKVSYLVESDAKGNGQWQTVATIEVPADGYANYIFPSGFRAEWVRITPLRNSYETCAWFELSENDLRKPAQSPAKFASIPSIGSKKAVNYGLVRAGREDGVELEYLSMNPTAPLPFCDAQFCIVDGRMKFHRVPDPAKKEWMEQNIGIISDFSIDQASVVVTDAKGNRFRLPKGDPAYASLPLPLRGIREVTTERSLLNCQGTFYELPRDISGGIACVKPITTHNRFIYDYCSWRGLLVLSGTVQGAKNDGNYFACDRRSGLWFGSIDDLWSLGKPVGTGGPWMNTWVYAGVKSDPYLMTGYDKKSLKLSHDQAETVVFTIEIDISAAGDYFTYATVAVKPGQTLDYVFPDGFKAHWVRFSADRNCRATAQLTYE